jgi:cobalt-precorrin 5A hydrolase
MTKTSNMSLENSLAIWVVTPNGAILADKMRRALRGADVFISNNIDRPRFKHTGFDRLKPEIEKKFEDYSGHVFIMSTGIVVRVIAPLIKHKTEDPAVVVTDDRGQHVISLLSGHLGGANQLTRQLADIVGGRPVITTATDINRLPAIDVLAQEKNLIIENPAAIKTVNMAIVKGETIYVHDPHNLLQDRLPKTEPRQVENRDKASGKDLQGSEHIGKPAVFVDDVQLTPPTGTLVLRPASLVAGIGCNRNTPAREIKTLLEAVLATAGLSVLSLKCLASIDVKSDEDGLIAAGRDYGLPLVFFERTELNQVMNIENPSTIVEKHVGVKSVCEAAAILAAQNGSLIVPKQKTKNVTVAIARIDFSSSASGPAAPIT